MNPLFSPSLSSLFSILIFIVDEEIEFWELLEKEDKAMRKGYKRAKYEFLQSRLFRQNAIEDLRKELVSDRSRLRSSQIRSEDSLDDTLRELYRDRQKKVPVLDKAYKIQDELNAIGVKKSQLELDFKYACAEINLPIHIHTGLWYNPVLKENVMILNENPLCYGFPDELMMLIFCQLRKYDIRQFFTVSKYFTVFLFKYPELAALKMYLF